METRPKPKKVSYLTVQDILWINLQVTKKVNRFDYAKLEEATYYQYAYGDSDELMDQAQRFRRGFLAKEPLSEGNAATAFVAVAAFLRLNGFELDVPDAEAAGWFRGDSAIRSTELEHGHSPSESMREVVTQVLKKYPAAVAELAGRPVPVVADGAIHG